MKKNPPKVLINAWFKTLYDLLDTNDDLSTLETENNILVDISVDANNAVVQGKR